MPVTITGGASSEIKQPTAVMIYNGKRYDVPIRYISISGNFLDFKSGIESTIYVFPKIDFEGGRLKNNPNGALIYLSPRVMRGMLAQKYILDDPFNKFPNFKIAHVEQNYIIDQLNQQGANLPEFIYYNGIQGPIKIWEIQYTGNEKFKPEYLDRDASKYLSWQL